MESVIVGKELIPEVHIFILLKNCTVLLFNMKTIRNVDILIMIKLVI